MHPRNYILTNQRKNNAEKLAPTNFNDSPVYMVTKNVLLECKRPWQKMFTLCFGPGILSKLIFFFLKLANCGTSIYLLKNKFSLK